jgi:hypothetical protein
MKRMAIIYLAERNCDTANQSSKGTYENAYKINNNTILQQLSKYFIA